jgi:hypothetical protein
MGLSACLKQEGGKAAKAAFSLLRGILGVLELDAVGVDRGASWPSSPKPTPL